MERYAEGRRFQVARQVLWWYIYGEKTKLCEGIQEIFRCAKHLNTILYVKQRATMVYRHLPQEWIDFAEPFLKSDPLKSDKCQVEERMLWRYC